MKLVVFPANWVHIIAGRDGMVEVLLSLNHHRELTESRQSLSVLSRRSPIT